MLKLVSPGAEGIDGSNTSDAHSGKARGWKDFDHLLLQFAPDARDVSIPVIIFIRFSSRDLHIWPGWKVEQRCPSAGSAALVSSLHHLHPPLPPNRPPSSSNTMAKSSKKESKAAAAPAPAPAAAGPVKADKKEKKEKKTKEVAPAAPVAAANGKVSFSLVHLTV